ncbi:hypothetical protein CsSME_00001554 [Camellia sinensis var. sinensis]
MVASVASVGLIHGFEVGERAGLQICVSPLFADDTILFFDEANVEELRWLSCNFLCFEAVSTLHMNLASDALIKVGDVENLDVLQGFLVVMWIHCVHLTWDWVMERFGRKLVDWRREYLSSFHRW